MYNISGNDIDQSKKRLNALSMGRKKKRASLANNINMPIQFFTRKLPHLQEFTFKADKLKISGYEASGVEVTYKFQPLKHEAVEIHQVKKQKTLFDELWLFLVKQSITTFFRYINMDYSQFLPYIVYLIFSLALGV